MVKLKHREMFGYALGDLGINFNFQAIGFLLSFYYTDIFGISPAHVAGLLLIARIWDAANDPIMGYIADHTSSRWGQFRPYIFFGAVPLNLILLACFFTPDISETGRVIYAYITYISHGMAFTMLGLPYSSLSAVMTQDQQERAVIASYRMFFACVIAQAVVTLGIPAMVSKFELDFQMTKQYAYFYSACFLALGSVVLLWTCFFSSKERVKVVTEKYHIKDMFQMIIKNDALLALSLAMLFNTGIWVTGNAVSFYYFKYILHDEAFSSQFFTVIVFSNLAGILLAPLMTKKYGKKNIFVLGSIIVALMGIIRYFLTPEQTVMILIISALFAIAQMFCSVTQWGMLPDTVEYGHWKTGIRSEGIPFSLFSFTQKAAMALAGSMAALVMASTGYIANTELVGSAAEGIRWLFNLVPAIYSLLCLVALYFYKINGPLYDRIIKELEESKKGNNIQTG
jgi:sugar (glycoside-pentoside-hexuronide) transporter